MHTLTLGKQNMNTSDENVALSNKDEREEHFESWETDTNCSKKNYSTCWRDMSSMYHGTWPLDRNMWDAESPALLRMETSSVMSFASSSGGVAFDQLLTTPDQSRRSSQQLEAKVDMVYSLLAMLGGQEHAEMGETLLALSISPESCLAMRQSGCLPLLVQLVQSDRDVEMRKKAAKALQNLVKSQPDEKARKREMKILSLLEVVTDYTESLENGTEFICDNLPPDGNKHPIQVISQIMKSSFDEGYRQAICQLGGIHSIARLLEIEHFVHGSITEETLCNQLRKYACMILTNLTFGDSGNKALLCSYKDFIRTLLIQLQSPNDELRQVIAGVLRNLSWRADSTSKEILREVGSVKSLMKAAMMDNTENTLISILSALWNLSAHCTENKSEICSVDGALIFLIRTLSYRSSSETLSVIENCGGLLRNISSQIAGSEEYRMILRKHNCFQVLVNHLKSSSLTVVSNACGTLWNLSSQNATDQEILWKLGAPSLLKNLNKSKHKMIAMGSSATLKNLLSAKGGQVFQQIDYVQPLDLRKQTNSNLIEVPDVDLPLDLSQKRSELELIEESRNIKSSSSTSLNVNEKPGSFMNEKSPQIRASCSSGLPYVNSIKSGSSLTCLPVRNKYAGDYEDVMESSERPFDFSRKYSETKSRDNSQKEKCSNVSYNYEKPKDENFSIYAETDLDQPTDYSLRYAENDSDSDSEECANIEKTRAEFVGDTVKTYCTEGTPYETPFNFSTSTSMSDLRMSDKNNSDNDKNAASGCKTKEVLSGKIHCVPVENAASEAQQPGSSKMKSELSSGLMSPEKPMNYCEEGTPGYFSRVSSFGSLNSSPVGQNENKVPEDVHKENNEVVPPKVDKVQPKVANNEVKVVKFESNVNYCEETPLMFSRSSSLGSLDSIEQNSIHDDRSSVISDYSRLTSGIISPSDLPDSPTQTIPPSPKPHKTSEFPINHRTTVESKSNILSNKVPRKSHVFEDHVTKFKEESTPMQFSTATSLSSLTIDDQDDGQIQGLVDNFKNRESSANTGTIVHNGVNMSQVQSNLPQSYRNISRTNIPRKPRRQIELPSPRNTSNLPLYGTASGVSILALPPEALPPPLPVENSVQTYCTEDTPAVLSHNGSISDLSLSTLSILDEEPVENKVYLSENSSRSSVVHENTRRRQSEMRPNKMQVAQQCNKEDNEEEYNNKGREEGVLTPPYITATDEVRLFAVENSPAQFSERSSLSNLTIGSSMMSDVNSLSLPKPNIPEEEYNNCCARISFNEDSEKSIPDEKVVVCKSTEKRWSLSNQESDTTHQCAILSEVEERVSVDTLRNRSNEFSTKEENSDHLCESFSNLELKSVNLEPQNGTISSDSSLKKRKWKWKWKFGSDTDEPGYAKEKIFGTESASIKKDTRYTVTKNEEVIEENDLNAEGFKSLDASYKKKKWWKWKFGAKGGEHCGTLVADVNKFAYLDVVPQNKELPSENPDVDSNKESPESPSFSRREDTVFIKSDNFKDNRNKSKRWKWKWKFGSKDGENPKSEEFKSLGLSKLKDSVSPVRKADCYMNEDRLQLPSLDNRRESRSASVKLSSRLLRSASEPPIGNKPTEEEHEEEVSRISSTSSIQCFEVDDIHVEEYERVLTPNEKTQIHSIGNVEESLDGQILKPRKASKSCTSDQESLVNSGIGSIMPIDKSQKKPDFASLIEECIQLGMPKKKEIPQKVEMNSNDSNARSSSKKIAASSGPEHEDASFDHMAVIEKCIQLCVPTTKDEIKSNTENAGEYLHFNKQTCDIVDAADVEMPKIMQKSEETENNAASTTMLLEKPSEVLATLKDSNSSTVVRNLTEKSSSSLKCNEISKNDLEFLRRQLSIADKHLLQEALTSGISKEQEAFLIELLIMKRVMTEAKQSERPHNYTVGLNSSDESSQSKKNKIICYSEEPLDPVTLSIVKRILQRKSEDCEYNSPKSVDLFDKVNSENCNFEIVLEERIKITLAGNRGIQNKYKVNSEDERDNASVSRLCIQDNFSSSIENTTEKNQSQDVGKENLDVKEQSKPVEVNKFIDSDSCNKSDTRKNQKCNMLEMSSSTSKLYENLSADSISKTLGCNENSFKARKDYAALVEECIKLGMPKKKELSEDTLYANISELPGYSRCHSLTRHEKISKFRTVSEINENIHTKSSKINTVTKDSKAIMEECIMMGMPKKNDAQLTKSSYNLNSYKETDAIVKTEKKPDYKSLLEECIQLGMPKNKEVFSETRSSSPKATTFQVNSTRTQSVIPTSPLVRRIEQCINNAKRSDTNEDPEEAIYANISATVGYSRLMQARALESNKKGSCDKQQDYSALVDECIKLGMPSRKRSEPNVLQENRNANETLSSKNPHYEALIEECIQLGMPKRKETSEDAIYANTLERYSSSKISPIMDFGCISPPPRRMLRSDSEPGFNKIPLVNVGSNKSGSVIPSYHTSMDRVLEECIQVGWPKNKEMISSRRTVELTTFSNPSRNMDVGKTKESESKNVNVASVVRNTREYQHMCCKTLPMATGAEEDSKLPGAIRMIEVPEIEEVQQVEPEKNGYKCAKLEYRVKIGI